jgi:hypothetical protein
MNEGYRCPTCRGNIILTEEEFKDILVLLADVWGQWAIKDKNGDLWAGGLTTLEDCKQLMERYNVPAHNTQR